MKRGRERLGRLLMILLALLLFCLPAGAAALETDAQTEEPEQVPQTETAEEETQEPTPAETLPDGV